MNKKFFINRVLGILIVFSMIMGSMIVAKTTTTEAALSSAADYAFDYLFYADQNPDLKAVFGYNEAALRNHWYHYGIKEGRKGSPVYNGTYYLKNNLDLINVYGDNNYSAAYYHFITWGYKEKRKSSEYYDGQYYASKNGDLSNMSSEELIRHYLYYGVCERRIAGTRVFEGDTANNYRAAYNGKLQISGNQSVSNGTYNIVSKLNGTSCIDIQNGAVNNGENAHLWNKANVQNQAFKLEYIGEGCYRIIAAHSNKCLDIHNGNMHNSNNVKQWDWADVFQQKWVIVNRGGGYYSIHSAKNTQYVLDVSGGNSNNGTNIQIYTYNGSNAQLFRFEPCGTSVPNTTAFQWPVTNSYVCGNAWSQYYSVKGKDHLGMDIKSSSGDKNIYAAGDGTVVQTGWNASNGNTITIRHTISGKTVYSFYGHLSSINVAKGAAVGRGQKIGVIGNTGGSSTGTHLHFAFTTQCSAGTWGYGTGFSDSANVTSYNGYTFYNPSYIIQNGKLP